MSGRLQIWHVGNWCIHLGQKYVESPFEAPVKDVEVVNYAQPFVDALGAILGAEVVSQPSWELYHMSSEAFDERLTWATTIVFADIETKCLMLHPHFFDRARWGEKPIVFPDRFDLRRAWIERGGHFHMNGGWLSFGGELGKGGWGRSRFHDVLPVECSPHDDLVESTAGYPMSCSRPEHRMVAGHRVPVPLHQRRDVHRRRAGCCRCRPVLASRNGTRRVCRPRVRSRCARGVPPPRAHAGKIASVARVRHRSQRGGPPQFRARGSGHDRWIALATRRVASAAHLSSRGSL